MIRLRADLYNYSCTVTQTQRAVTQLCIAYLFLIDSFALCSWFLPRSNISMPPLWVQGSRTEYSYTQSYFSLQSTLKIYKFSISKTLRRQLSSWFCGGLCGCLSHSNNALFYVLFLRNVAHGALQSKEPKQSQTVIISAPISECFAEVPVGSFKGQI